MPIYGTTAAAERETERQRTWVGLRPGHGAGLKKRATAYFACNYIVMSDTSRVVHGG